jgi:hypothetical protein
MTMLCLPWQGEFRMRVLEVIELNGVGEHLPMFD